MNCIYEKINSATTVYSKEEQNTTALHKGRRYTLEGESLGREFSSGKKFCNVMAIIGLLVAAIFSCGLIFIGMASQKFREMTLRPFKELQAGRQINLHYVLQSPEQWQRDAVRPFIEALKFSIINNDQIPKQLTCTSCCICIQYNHGESNARDIPFEDRSKIKKQFLFRNEDNSPLSVDELNQKIDTLENHLISSIEEEIDVATTSLNFACTVLHQESPVHSVNASYVAQSFSKKSFPEISHTSKGLVEGLLKFVYVNIKDVLSDDGKQILAAPGCMAIP